MCVSNPVYRSLVRLPLSISLLPSLASLLTKLKVGLRCSQFLYLFHRLPKRAFVQSLQLLLVCDCGACVPSWCFAMKKGKISERVSPVEWVYSIKEPCIKCNWVYVFSLQSTNKTGPECAECVDARQDIRDVREREREREGERERFSQCSHTSELHQAVTEGLAVFGHLPVSPSHLQLIVRQPEMLNIVIILHRTRTVEGARTSTS